MGAARPARRQRVSRQHVAAEYSAVNAAWHLERDQLELRICRERERKSESRSGTARAADAAATSAASSAPNTLNFLMSRTPRRRSDLAWGAPTWASLRAVNIDGCKGNARGRRELRASTLNGRELKLGRPCSVHLFEAVVASRRWGRAPGRHHRFNEVKESVVKKHILAALVLAVSGSVALADVPTEPVEYSLSGKAMRDLPGNNGGGRTSIPTAIPDDFSLSGKAMRDQLGNTTAEGPPRAGRLQSPSSTVCRARL